MNPQAAVARSCVLFGGSFWVTSALGAVTYLTDSPLSSPAAALIPLVIAVVAFLIGWFYEGLAAVLLFAGAVVIVIWGVLAGWEAGVWMIMMGSLIAELVVAGVLFLLAARTEKICELQESQAA